MLRMLDTTIDASNSIMQKISTSTVLEKKTVKNIVSEREKKF